MSLKRIWEQWKTGKPWKAGPTAQQLADAVVTYAEAYGLQISKEANDLWDLVEQVATRLPPPFSQPRNYSE